MGILSRVPIQNSENKSRSSCLEDAEVQGDIPELSTEWWNEIGEIYPEFRKEVKKRN